MALIEIFKAGTWTDSRGVTREFSRADLDQLVTNGADNVPLYVHHDESGPVQGVLDRIHRFGDRLLAYPKDVAADFSSRFQGSKPWQLSVKLARGSNGWMLKHLAAVPQGAVDLEPAEFSALSDSEHVYSMDFGASREAEAVYFLGRQVSMALRGIRDLMLSSSLMTAEAVDNAIPNYLIDDLGNLVGILDDESTPTFSSEENMTRNEAEIAAKEAAMTERETSLAAKEAEIKARELAADLAEFSAFTEAQLNQGKVFDSELASAVYANLPTDEAQFSYGNDQKTVGTKAAFKAFIASLPKTVELGTEFASPDNAPAAPSDAEFSQAALNIEARNRAKEKGISFSEAIRQVASERSA